MSTDTEKSLVETKQGGELSTAMSGGGLIGMEQVADSYVASYIKIVQAMTGQEWKPPYKDGDVVLTPDKILILEGVPDVQHTKVHIAPVFLFPEYTIHNPLDAPGLQFIRERTLSRDTEIYRKCKLRDMKERRFICPEFPENDEGQAQYCTYSEQINVCMVILDHPDVGYEPVIASLHSGEWLRAQSFIKLLRARSKHMTGQTQIQKPNAYQHRFQMTCSLHHRKGGQKGSWFGLDIFNPEDGGRYIEDPEVEQHLRNINKMFESQYKADEIETRPEEENVIDAVSVAEAKF